MFRAVCTKHCKDLIPSGDALHDNMVVMVSFMDENPSLEGPIYYTFDLSHLACPDNNVDEYVLGQLDSNFEDCALWYNVVDEEGWCMMVGEIHDNWKDPQYSGDTYEDPKRCRHREFAKGYCGEMTCSNYYGKRR